MLNPSFKKAKTPSDRGFFGQPSNIKNNLRTYHDKQSSNHISNGNGGMNYSNSAKCDNKSGLNNFDNSDITYGMNNYGNLGNSLVNSGINNFGNSLVDSGMNSLVNSGMNSGMNFLVNSGMNSFGNSGMNSFDNSGMNSFGNSGMNSFGNSGMNSFGNSGMNSFGNSGMNSFVNSGMNSFGNSGMNSFVNSGMNSFVNSGMNSFGNSFGNSGMNNVENYELSETVKTLGHIPIVYDGNDHYNAIIKKSNTMGEVSYETRNKRKRVEAMSLSKDEYEVYPVSLDGDCFFTSILVNCPDIVMSSVMEQEDYLNRKNITWDDELQRKILFLRHQLADTMESKLTDDAKAVLECDGLSFDEQIEKLRTLGNFDIMLFDVAVTIADESFCQLLGKNIRIYDEESAMFNRRIIDLGQPQEHNKRRKACTSKNPNVKRKTCTSKKKPIKRKARTRKKGFVKRKAYDSDSDYDPDKDSTNFEDDDNFTIIESDRDESIR